MDKETIFKPGFLRDSYQIGKYKAVTLEGLAKKIDYENLDHLKVYVLERMIRGEIRDRKKLPILGDVLCMAVGINTLMHSFDLLFSNNKNDQSQLYLGLFGAVMGSLAIYLGAATFYRWHVDPQRAYKEIDVRKMALDSIIDDEN